MVGAVGLLGFSAALMIIGQYLLPRLRWLHRSPRLGIALWQAVTAVVVGSLLLGLLALTMPGLSAAATLGELARACAIELQRQYSTWTGAIATTTSIAMLFAVSGRLEFVLYRQRRIDQRAQRAHMASLAMLTERTSSDGVVVVDHDTATVYCVQGSRRAGTADTVVVTKGALEALSPAQMALVLRHEQAHLGSRHAQLVARAHALSRALPRLGFFRVAHQQIALLAEMHADDAVAVGDRKSLAAALYDLAVANGPVRASGALAATGSDVVVRAQRLLGPHNPLPRTATALVVAAIVALVLTPAALALVPGGVEESHACCLRTQDTMPLPAAEPASVARTHAMYYSE